MKNNLPVQIFAGSNNNSATKDLSLLKNNSFEATKPQVPYQPVLVQQFFSAPENSRSFYQPFTNTSNSLLTLKTEKFRMKIPGNKNMIEEGDQLTLLNRFMQQSAIRLSDVELAINNEDLQRLEFSTLILKDLFLDMKIPMAYQLAEQLEELAGKNKLTEAGNTLLSIKKIIAREVQRMQELSD
ncbi:MAG TPA: hypothetical protein VI548_13480 [Chitinophagaceae bacterium]|nr:hypothetical protein [Chitinophagaceae bacterium]